MQSAAKNASSEKPSVDPKEPGFWSIIFDWLHSLRLTIFLLILLALLSILGTVIPQNQPAGEYLKFYSPVKYQAYLALGLLDMYHSWWFISLLTLLGVNLMACSWRRLPVVLKQMSGPPPLLTDTLARSCTMRRTFQIPRQPGECRAEAESILSRRYRLVRADASKDAMHLAADRGRYARLGVLITHSSVLIILLGGMIGSIFGFKGYVNIIEGQGIDRVLLQKSMMPLPLGFVVRCDEFDVSFYNDGTPKDYRSRLAVLEDGKEILTQDVRVNHPLVYRGITFYQSSYGNAGPPKFEMEIRNRQSGQAEVKAMEFQQMISMAAGDSAFRIEDYRESVMGRGPAVRVARFEGTKRAGEFWVFRDATTAKEMDGGPWSFTLLGVRQPRYTGLQVARDPGVWLVWAGSALLVVGMIVALFMSHRRIWARITPEKDGARILLAGRSTRNPLSFQKEFESLSEAFSTLALEAGAPVDADDAVSKRKRRKNS